MNQISADLAHCILTTIDNKKVSFESLYAEETTLIFFVRHFGCIFCRERVSSLLRALPLLESQPIKVCVVGNGDIDYASDFVEQLALPFPVYCDLEGDAYRLAGMQRNFGLKLSTLKDAWRSYQSGHRQHKTAGNVWQQGGVLVVTPKGTLLETHADKSAGEYMNIPEFIERVIEKLSSIQEPSSRVELS